MVGTRAPAGATRRTGPELEDAILDAAKNLLLDRGYPAFTYEAVAARAGTSRPVLYRRWPQRNDLLLATLKKFWMAQPVVVPDTGSLRDDAIALLRSADSVRVHLVTLIGAQLNLYFRETGSNFARLREALRPPGQPNPLQQCIARAVQRGEIPDVPRPRRVVSLPFDLFCYEVFMTMCPVPDEAITEMVDAVWLPLLRQPGQVHVGAARARPKVPRSGRVRRR